jgi:hypothetical protein
MFPIDFGVKGQVHWTSTLKNAIQTPECYPFRLETPNHTYGQPMRERVPKILLSPFVIHSGKKLYRITPFKRLGKAGDILVSIAHGISNQNLLICNICMSGNQVIKCVVIKHRQ